MCRNLQEGVTGLAAAVRSAAPQRRGGMVKPAGTATGVAGKAALGETSGVGGAGDRSLEGIRGRAQGPGNGAGAGK